MAKKQGTTADPRSDALSQVLTDIEALYPGSVMRANHPDLTVVRRETGVLPLDLALDGGLPRGRFIEVYGSYSTLKSYWAYKAIAAAQSRGERVALIDYEHSWDPDWGTTLGVDIDNLIVSTPRTAEQGFGTLDLLIRQRFDLIVWDSIAAAQPKQYYEAAPGDDDAPAALARVFSRGLARVTGSNKHSTVLFINQERATIGVTFGAKKTTSGGNAMGFYASMRLSFVRTGKITENVKKWDGETYIDGKRVIGHKIQATLEKSKVSAPYATTHFVFDLRTGAVDDVGYLIGAGLEEGLIQRTKAGHHTIPGVLDKPIHGKDAFRTWVEETPEVLDWLKAALLGDPDA